MSLDVRPPSFFLSWQALLSLPTRICNPPPAASSVRSCKVTPLINVALDDVLNKRHLPPLTLKDFEEWLIYVEGDPRCLYFILWLKEYESRYAAWLAESGFAFPVGSHTDFSSSTTLGADIPDPKSPCSPRDRDLSYVNLIPSSPTLALFFTRAKQTFLDPACDSPYALGVEALRTLAPYPHYLSPPDPPFAMAENRNGIGMVLLPPSLATHPHPHPTELAPLANYARKALKESLRCFAQAACHNSGTRRAWCGVAGGAFLTLVLGILPALTTYCFASSRWWRFIGLFGCWLGGTVIISSLHGICMLIYIFGDLRQLRPFELARPTISEPHPIARASPRLKYFFTRDGEEDELVTRTRDGEHHDLVVDNAGTQTGVSAVSAPLSFRPFIPSESGTQSAVNPMQKLPWFSESESETSTGTPVVRLGPSAFGLNTTVSESGVSIVLGSTALKSVSKVECEHDDETDFGIEISPAYYSSDPAVPRGGGRPPLRESIHSAGSISKIGLVLQWVIGKRGSVGASTSPSEKAVGQMNNNLAQGQVRRYSYTGTFDTGSRREGLGSLPDQSCDRGGDLKSAFDVIQTEMLVDGYRIHDPDVGSQIGDIDSAHFITRGHPEPNPRLDISIHSSLDVEPMVAEMKTSVEKTHASSPVSSSVFDFDQRPGKAAVRRLSTPCTFASSNVLPSPQSLLLPPRPSALYAHPGARLVSSSPRLILEETWVRSQPMEGKQWWDVCPRHPAVDAAIQGHKLPLALDSPLSYDSISPVVDPASPASSPVHSRVRVKIGDMNIDPSVRLSWGGVPDSIRKGGTSRAMRLRYGTGVPVFSPLTRVLEPLISRGQWEIVMRSTIIAALGAWIVIGCLLALPQTR